VNLRKTVAAAGAGLAIAGAAAVAPAHAADTTPVSLTVTTSGGLAVSVPAVASGSFVDLGSVAAGSVAATTANPLGEIAVTDTRTGLLNNNWTMSASASNLLLNGDAAYATDATRMIPATSIGYVAGTLTQDVSQLGQVLTAVPAPALAVSVPVVTNVALGVNTTRWSPKLSVTVLPTNVAGTYKGSVTHSIL
jgi:hypothetical protein